MGELSDRYNGFLRGIPKDVKIVAVSKTISNEGIEEIYNCGQKTFGENKVQELTGKAESLPDDIEWHMIGHLQSNKVKFIAPFISMVHSIDSFKLLISLNKEAKKNQRIIDCLFQVYIAEEETKFGFSENEVRSILDSTEFNKLENIRINGLMGMASFTEDTKKVREEFKSLKVFFDTLKKQYFQNFDYFAELSMGMSSDYKIAIQEGATMIRVGSLIFGERNYSNH